MKKIATASAVVLVGMSLVRPMAAARQQRDVRADATFTDYLDETTGTVTRAFAGNALSYNFLQAGPDGVGRDVVAQITPSEGFAPEDGDDEISLPTGDIVIVRPYLRISPNAYTISYRFHIPRDVLPEEYQRLATDPTLAAGPFQWLTNWVARPLFAAGGDGISGISNVTYMPGTISGSGPGNSAPPAGVVDPDFANWYENNYRKNIIAPEDLKEKRIADFERKLIGQQITGDTCLDPEVARARDFVRRARELADAEIRFGKLTPAQQAASGEAQQLAARRAAIDAELRGGRSFTPVNSTGAARTGVRVAGNAVAAGALALKLVRIQADSDRWKKRLKDLKDCAENPTNPLTRRAVKEDPNYRRATLDPIAAAELEEKFVTNTRRAAATTNSGAETTFKLLGATVVGLLGQIEDGLLERSMEQTLEQLEECVARCRKRALKVDFTFAQTEPLPGGRRITDMSGSAMLPIVASGEGYEGEGRATFKSDSSLVAGCQRE